MSLHITEIEEAEWEPYCARCEWENGTEFGWCENSELGACAGCERSTLGRRRVSFPRVRLHMGEGE